MMNKTYDPKKIEQHWYQYWETNGYFQPSGQGEPYAITLPPPNVTGTLHMGHGFQVTLMDTLIRYHRMMGRNVLWQAGTDHAGIATQMVVERELAKNNLTRQQIGRNAFEHKVWEWKTASENTIKNQLRKMGASLDWSREKFTLDESVCEAVRKVFIELYEEGLIYRGQRLVNWDPKLHTAVSDLEVVTEEKQGELWHIRYPLADSKDYLMVATTRPETLLGDTALAVHPEDERYQHLIGKQVQLPLCARTIPIIADDYVEQAFGTGIVKITPAHDFNDYEVGQRHKLPMINILTPDAKINENAPEAYQGLDRFAARKQIIADLQQQGLLDKTEPHKLQIPKGEKTGEIIEPRLTDQWFVKMPPLAAPAITAVKKNLVEFIPNNWAKIYFQWLENIQDWCISRQLWWGHRIPAWYDEQDNLYVGDNEQAVRKKYQLADDIMLRQEEDVLDTWFSSALWPFATLGWPEQTMEFKTFYPNNVLVTGFDIIFFWVARMIIQGLKFTGNVPFKQVYIHGLIRDHDGQKMSKTKGNVIDPIDVINGIDLETLVRKRTAAIIQTHLVSKIEKATREEFPEGIPALGTDALRFTYCALATTGRDIRFDLDRVTGYRNFCNKIWNAARYVMMQHDTNTPSSDGPVIVNNLNLPDRWIQAKLQQTIHTVHSHFNDYRFDLLAQAIYDFIWHDYCDWYVELTKPILQGEQFSPEQKQAARQTLLEVLETVVRLLHPIMPFITEEIWQQLTPLLKQSGPTIMLQPYPLHKEVKIDQQAVQQTQWLIEAITAIRTLRAENNISPKQHAPLLIKNEQNSHDIHLIQEHRTLFKALAKIDSIDLLDQDQQPPVSASTYMGQLIFYVPLAGLIDIEAEIQRLEKTIHKLKKELERSQTKLANPAFIDKAPKAVVTKEKQRVEETKSSLVKLQTQLDSLQQH